MGIKTDGVRCTRTSVVRGDIFEPAPHLHFCDMHWTVYTRHVADRVQRHPRHVHHHHQDGTCHHWITTGVRWCGLACGGLLCPTHLLAMINRQERKRIHDEHKLRIRTIFEAYRDHDPAMSWRQMMQDIWTRDDLQLNRADRYQVCRMYFNHRIAREPEFNQHWQFTIYFRWMIEGAIGEPPNLVLHPIPDPPPVPRAQNDLARIAADNQNVHTRIVSQQTNRGLEKLLAAGVGRSAIRGPEWIGARWLVKCYGRWEDVSRTIADMKHWYNLRMCRTQDDRLYQRALDGLYWMIRDIDDEEIRNELYKRVFEECVESVGLCCDGHISRLCNVLVGFDEAFTSQFTFGESVQNRMATIYGMEIDTPEKIRLAIEFFNDYGVAETERVSWLEAF